MATLRKIIDIDESSFHVKFLLECGHISLMWPYKFKQHRPYPKRRRCFPNCKMPEEDAQ